MNQINNIADHYLYRHIRLDKNEPFYIGIGTKRKDYKKYSREYTRAYAKKARNYIWKGITKRSDYRVEILLESNNYDFINQKEKEFISLYGKIIDDSGTLANFTDGGGGILGYCHDEEAKEKISKSGTKYKVAKYSLKGDLKDTYDSISEAAKDVGLKSGTAICEVCNGNGYSSGGYQWRKFYNIPKKSIAAINPEKERRKNISEGTIKWYENNNHPMKGKKLNKEKCKNISDGLKGRKLSEETKEKLRKCNLGKTHSKETKKKISKINKGMDGIKVKHLKTGKIFNSLTNGCKEFGLDYKLEHARINKNYNTKKFIKIE